MTPLPQLLPFFVSLFLSHWNPNDVLRSLPSVVFVLLSVVNECTNTQSHTWRDPSATPLIKKKIRKENVVQPPLEKASAGVCKNRRLTHEGKACSSVCVRTHTWMHCGCSLTALLHVWCVFWVQPICVCTQLSDASYFLDPVGLLLPRHRADLSSSSLSMSSSLSFGLSLPADEGSPGNKVPVVAPLSRNSRGALFCHRCSPPEEISSGRGWWPFYPIMKHHCLKFQSLSCEAAGLRAVFEMICDHSCERSVKVYNLFATSQPDILNCDPFPRHFALLMMNDDESIIQNLIINVLFIKIPTAGEPATPSQVQEQEVLFASEGEIANKNTLT